MDRTLKRIEESGLADLQHFTAPPRIQRSCAISPASRSPPWKASSIPKPISSPFTQAPTAFAIMTKQFFKVLRQNDIDLREEQDFYKTLILASIVQKERSSTMKAPRLPEFCAVDCASACLCRAVPPWITSLKSEAFAARFSPSKTPRSTTPITPYVYPGLPPTPIANPHINAILAALNPIDRGFLYFFADNKGNNVFSATFEEHQNKQRNMRHAR